MKIKLKLLFLSMMFIGLGLSFCSAGTYTFTSDSVSECPYADSCYTPNNISISGNYLSSSFVCNNNNGFGCSIIFFNTETFERCDINDSLNNCVSFDGSNYVIFGPPYEDGTLSYAEFNLVLDGDGGTSSPTPEITVYYNNGQSSTSVECDGTQAISINGLSTITSTNTFTPYYNISYTDEDNQKLIESYSKDILYLESGQFKKTYTGNNERILTVQGNDSENSFSGYLPTFDITGGIEEVSESGNIFNNFAENSVKFTLANIPSYIQYFIILLILFLILGFVKKFKRK